MFERQRLVSKMPGSMGNLIQGTPGALRMICGCLLHFQWFRDPRMGPLNLYHSNSQHGEDLVASHVHAIDGLRETCASYSSRSR